MVKENSFINLLFRPHLLIALVITLLLLVLITGYRSIKVTEDTLIDEFNHRQLAMADEASGGMTLYIEFLAGSLKALVSAQRIDEQGLNHVKPVLEGEYRELETLGVNDIAIINHRGIVKYSVNANQLVGRDFSWRNYFKQSKAAATSESYFIEFI